MKTCSYCGRESDEALVSCRECGTAFDDNPPEARPLNPRRLAWMDHALRYMVSPLLACFVYLLSLGPVLRYTVGPPVQTKLRSANSVVFRSVQTCPKWVRVLYYPAFTLEGGLEPYNRYIRWWQKRLD